MSSYDRNNKQIKELTETSENIKKSISSKSNKEKDQDENFEADTEKDNFINTMKNEEDRLNEKNIGIENNEDKNNQENEDICENLEEKEQEQNKEDGDSFNDEEKRDAMDIKTNEKTQSFSLKEVTNEHNNLKEKNNLKYISTSMKYDIEKKTSFNANLRSKVEQKKVLNKESTVDDIINENKKDDPFMKKSKILTKDSLKPDTRDLFFNSQEKDVFEYIPDTSSYSICHNNPNELYKDMVSMNKHFLDEVNTNIYASPLNTYLSNVVASSDNNEQKKKSSLEMDYKMRKNTLNDEKKDILDETGMESKYSYEFFKNKIFKYYDNGVIVEIDPSKLKYNNSIQYEYNKNLSSYLDDPLSYLNGLKCEVDDITTYVRDLGTKNEELDSFNKSDILNEEDLIENEKIVKQILHNREIPEVLLELLSLKKDIDNIINDDKLTKLLKTEKASEEKNATKDIDDIKNLIDKLKNIDENSKSKDNVNLGKEFNIYTVKTVKEKDVSVNDLLMLERKISQVEKVLGIDKMPMLPYDDINHAILDLYNKLSLLDSNKLESVKKKVQNLQSEFLNLKKFKKDVLNISKERGNYEESIDELFKILDVWKKTHHIIPNILTRLHQLKKIHDNAQSFASRLDDLEKQQIKLDHTLSLAEKNIKLINCKIDENVNLLQDTLKQFESKASIKNKI